MSYNDTGSLILGCICSMLFAFAVIMMAGWLSMAHAQDAEEGPPPSVPPFMLMLTVHTPGRQPDVHKNYPMKTLADCWESAKAFVEEGEVPEGAVGISAGCGKSKVKESNS